MHKPRWPASSQKANIQDACAWLVLVFSISEGLLSWTKIMTGILWPLAPQHKQQQIPQASISLHQWSTYHHQSRLVSNYFTCGRFSLQIGCKIYTVLALWSIWWRLATDLLNERGKIDWKVKVIIGSHLGKYVCPQNFTLLYRNVHHIFIYLCKSKVFALTMRSRILCHIFFVLTKKQEKSLVVSLGFSTIK